jgi:hypothetical protein
VSALTDMNDLRVVKGPAAVKAVVDAARPIGSPAGADAARPELAPLAPPRMPAEGFVPLVRAIVDAACESSEAHPVAVAANVIAFFSAMIGRGLYQRIGDTAIHCRPFILVAGKSGKARKGTAEATAREIHKRACALLRTRLGNDDRLRVHAGGLSTGEGVGWAIRDAVDADDNGKGGDQGINDKRLLVIEPEFDNMLSQLRRENNTLSATVRNLFDGRDLEPLTKTSRTCATRPHVVIIGHVTGHELREKSTENDAANGLLNRFLMAYVYRPKLVALPEPTPEWRLEQLADQVAGAIVEAAGDNLHANNTAEVTMSPAARALWIESYPALTRDRDGKGGSLLARSEMYARMLAMIFAAMDGRRTIEPADLRAAIAWVDYWHASVTYIFNCPDEEGGLDPFTTEVLALITTTPGISLTGLQKHWSNKKGAAIKKSLDALLNLAPPLVEQRKDESTGGRAAFRYFAYGKKGN